MILFCSPRPLFLDKQQLTVRVCQRDYGFYKLVGVRLPVFAQTFFSQPNFEPVIAWCDVNLHHIAIRENHPLVVLLDFRDPSDNGRNSFPIIYILWDLSKLRNCFWGCSTSIFRLAMFSNLWSTSSFEVDSSSGQASTARMSAASTPIQAVSENM